MSDPNANMTESLANMTIVNELTDSELSRINKACLRAKKAKIDQALGELNEKYEETKHMIARELANSNTAMPECIQAIGSAINDLDVTRVWAHHETEMAKSKANREQDHWDRLRETRERMNRPETICEMMKKDPMLVLDALQMLILQRHFNCQNCL